eukprot:TRINITY_DN6159_c0_g1_i1.p1 TRINITY_DN6159_c0_g1~~TRINITY_DN6159_c0_g1_i1.p1  ORF type:complete len:363 (+),score=79.11 TRINITY_DN6159_c0_g1_i1:110-1090(+)
MPVPIVLGGAVFSNDASWGGKVVVGDDAQKFLDVFKAHGHKDIDTARVYGKGSSEKVLGDLRYEEQGLILDTKILSKGKPHPHSEVELFKSFEESLASLRAKKVHILYLHSPDRTTPFIETVTAINKLYQQGLFEKFGISNYRADEVREILDICEKQGFVRPTVYQGHYNFIMRGVEEELLPLLRKERIAFYAYSPLASGFLNGKVQSKEEKPEAGSRFDSNTSVGPTVQKWYFKDSYFAIIKEYLEFVKSHNLTTTEVPLRWLQHHSQLNNLHGDALIVGASSPSQLETNLSELKKGPLSQEVVDFLEKIWATLKPDAPTYYIPF